MHLQIGHGHEERHRKESYIVYIPQKYSYFVIGKNSIFQLFKNTFIGSF